MTESTTPQLSESDVAELADMFPHAEYDPDTSEMPVCATCGGAIDDHRANCAVPLIHALIRDWRALRAELAVTDEFKRLTDGLVAELQNQINQYREENADLRRSVEEWVSHYNEVEAGRAQLSVSNAALREQLAQVISERDEARQKLMRRCTHPNTYALKEATRRCHDCGAEILL